MSEDNKKTAGKQFREAVMVKPIKFPMPKPKPMPKIGKARRDSGAASGDSIGSYKKKGGK